MSQTAIECQGADSGLCRNPPLAGTRAKQTEGTDVLLATSLPAGVQVTTKGNVKPQVGKPFRPSMALSSISAFHVAGPLNMQADALVGSRRLRLKLGRGARYNRCPLSLQTEFQPGSNAAADYEVGLRYKFREDGLRRLRARLLLPATAARSAWIEYQDSSIDSGGVWFAKLALPLSGDEHRKPELSLRRAWQW